MASKPKYRVLIGVNYPPDNKRAEAGDEVTDLPEAAIKRLVRDGVVELVPPTKEERDKAEAKKAKQEPEEIIVEHIEVTPEKGAVVKEEKVER